MKFNTEDKDKRFRRELPLDHNKRVLPESHKPDPDKVIHNMADLTKFVRPLVNPFS